MSEKAALSYLVKASLKAELQKLADADRRKLGPYIEIVLENHVADEKAKAAAAKRGQR